MTEENGNNRSWYIGGGAVVILIALLFLWKPADHWAPDELVGEWHTNETSHADRTMDIGPTSISFTTGEGTVTTGTIKKVSKSEQGARTLYVLEYEVDGDPNQVSFYLEEQQTRRVIRFKNQQNIIWTKDGQSLENGRTG